MVQFERRTGRMSRRPEVSLQPVTSIELSVRGMRLDTRVCGSESAPIVVLLHGFPDHPSSFEPLMQVLAEAGFRAVAPTARGYTPAALAPDGDYRIETLALDVVGVLDAFGAPRVHLLGHDWGAVVAHTVGALHADRLLSLTTLAVPHLARLPGQLLRRPWLFTATWYQAFFQLPGLSDWAVQRRDWALVRWLCRRWSPVVGSDGWAFTDAEWTERVRRFDQPGVRAAMLAYYRQNLSLRRWWQLVTGGLEAVRVIPVRTLAITGARDGCMDSQLYTHGLDEADFPAGLRVERLEEAGHFVHLERPARTAELLLDWLGAPG